MQSAPVCEISQFFPLIRRNVASSPCDGDAAQAQTQMTVEGGAAALSPPTISVDDELQLRRGLGSVEESVR